MPYALPVLSTENAAKLRQLGAWLQDRIGVTIVELVKIDWPNGVKWYSDGQHDANENYKGFLPYVFPTTNDQIERRLLKDDTVRHFVNIGDTADIGDDKQTFIFQDDDRGFARLYDEFKGNVPVEIWYYVPALDFFFRRWSGHLDSPQQRTRGRVTISASVGNRSNEDYYPDVIRGGSGCPATFGGRLTTLDDVRESGCAFNAHLSGGTIGNASAIETYGMCKQRSEADCLLYLPAGYYAGGDVGGVAGTTTNVGVTASGGNAIRGNDSAATEPWSIYQGAEQFTTHQAIALFAFADTNLAHPERAARQVIAEAGIGPCQISSDVKIDGKPVEYQQLWIRDGAQGQAPVPFRGGIHNFSNIAHVMGVTFGNDPNAPASGIRVELTFTSGFSLTRIYSDENTFTRAASSSRVWNLLAGVTNNFFGRGRSWQDFHIPNLIAVDARCGESVQFGDKDGTVRSIQRSRFNHYHQGGRSAAQIIREICLWGNFLPPQIIDGKLYLIPLDKEPDLSLCPVYHDEAWNGYRSNILQANGTTSVVVTKELQPRDRVYKLHVNLYDKNYRNKKRTLTIWDRERESFLLGKGQVAKAPANYDAIGITDPDEAQFHAEEILYLGEFGSGGILNPYETQFQIPYYQAIADQLYKGKVIRLLSDVVPRKFDDLNTQQFEYFRILDMPTDNGLITTVRVAPYVENFYNRETVAGPPAPPLVVDPANLPGGLPFDPIINPGSGGTDSIVFTPSF